MEVLAALSVAEGVVVLLDLALMAPVMLMEEMVELGFLPQLLGHLCFTLVVVVVVVALVALVALVVAVQVLLDLLQVAPQGQ
jgi:hypothetical protein